MVVPAGWRNQTDQEAQLMKDKFWWIAIPALFVAQLAVLVTHVKPSVSPECQSAIARVKTYSKWDGGHDGTK